MIASCPRALQPVRAHLDEVVLTPDDDTMAYAEPQFTKTQVSNAGQALIGGPSGSCTTDQAFHIINNWRASHSFPLNTFQIFLRRKAKAIDPGCLVAQRIKRRRRSRQSFKTSRT